MREEKRIHGEGKKPKKKKRIYKKRKKYSVK